MTLNTLEQTKSDKNRHKVTVIEHRPDLWNRLITKKKLNRGQWKKLNAVLVLCPECCILSHMPIQTDKCLYTVY